MPDAALDGSVRVLRLGLRSGMVNEPGSPAFCSSAFRRDAVSALALNRSSVDKPRERI